MKNECANVYKMRLPRFELLQLYVLHVHDVCE